MKPKSVLPVQRVEVLSDGRFISPILAVSTLTSEHAGWDGVALEYTAMCQAAISPSTSTPRTS